MNFFMLKKTLGRACQKGFTLLELMIAVAILAIIITVAFPSFSDIGDTQRLVGATEQIYGHIQQTRSESVTGNTPAYIKFDADGTNSWEYGFSTTGTTCDLTVSSPLTANACVTVVDDGDGNVDPGDGTVDTDDLILNHFDSTEWNDVKLSIASFSSGTSQIEFDPVRGTSTDGEINLESGNGKRLRIEVSLLGRPTICNPSPTITVSNYAGC